MYETPFSFGKNHAKKELAELQAELSSEEDVNLEVFWLVRDSVAELIEEGDSLEEILESFKNKFGMTPVHEAMITKAYNICKKLYA